jgi:hypothetical protein
LEILFVLQVLRVRAKGGLRKKYRSMLFINASASSFW